MTRLNQYHPICIILFFLLLFSAGTFSQTNKPAQQYQLVTGRDFVQSKNYYLLTLLEELPDVKKLLAADEVLAGMASAKVDALAAALKDCGRDGNCFLDKMNFSQTEIRSAGERLSALYQPQNALGKMVQKHLIPSGAYVLFQGLPAKEMLLKAWEQDANGINFCIGVYAGGNKPNYPLIDSISFKTKDPQNNNLYLNSYVGLLYNSASLLVLDNNNKNAFFAVPLHSAVLFLEMNERDQAADFEPMLKGENKPAADRVKTINWKEYQYSVILVPGAGPNDPEVALSAEGMLRCRLAAIQYKTGLAPFIIPSGGKVHPYKTKFCEATEMKKYLMEKLQIPENAILIEPHARHTTTNMRNAARMMFRYGIPFEKPGITCTTRGQSNMIGNTLMARCKKELNEVPYKNGNRLSETAIEFYPLIEALHINPLEPMDP